MRRMRQASGQGLWGKLFTGAKYAMIGTFVAIKVLEWSVLVLGHWSDRILVQDDREVTVLSYAFHNTHTDTPRRYYSSEARRDVSVQPHTLPPPPPPVLVGLCFKMTSPKELSSDHD